MLRWCLFLLFLTFTIIQAAQISHFLDLYELQPTQESQDLSIGNAVHRRRSLKIANGGSIPSSIDQRFPYSALLVFRDSVSENIDHRVCAGVLIRPQWVLTAGSCVMRAEDVSEIFVGFGDRSPRPADLLDNEDARLVVSGSILPGFSGNPREGQDLALLYIRHPVNTTLPRLPELAIPLGEGQRLVGLGWGVTEVNSNYADRLQVADQFRFMEQGQCGQVWSDVNNVTATINEQVICVRPGEINGNEASMSICDGDEGGPLLFLDTASFDFLGQFTFGGNPERDVVHGIASFGPETCGDQEFSVYTNIVEYMPWIIATIETFVPPDLNVLVPPSSSEDDHLDTVLTVGCIVGGLVLAIVFLIWYFFWGRTKKSSESSTGGNVTTRLRKAESEERRRQQIAMMSLSPFLTSPEMDGLPIENETAAGSSQNPQKLPTDISAKLVGHKIGSGAFGSVEEGIFVDKEGVEHRVAVKFNFGEESKEILLNEIRVFERVGQHPNVVHCFGGNLNGSAEDESGCYIIEELVTTDLGKYFRNVQRRKRITFRKFLEVFFEIAYGLEHLHKCDVIHFDLKPGNILLDDTQRPKLADFGCSRLRAHSYITAGVCGTFAYMAPELWLLGVFAKRAQVRGEKVDIFSLGVVMWEILTNRNPKDPLSMKELIGSEEMPISAEESERETNEDFRNDRFPFETLYPDRLKALIWDCVGYYNYLRPTIQEVKQRIQELLTAEWIHQNIDHYRP